MSCSGTYRRRGAGRCPGGDDQPGGAGVGAGIGGVGSGVGAGGVGIGVAAGRRRAPGPAWSRRRQGHVVAVHDRRRRRRRRRGPPLHVSGWRLAPVELAQRRVAAREQLSRHELFARLDLVLAVRADGAALERDRDPGLRVDEPLEGVSGRSAASSSVGAMRWIVTRRPPYSPAAVVGSPTTAASCRNPSLAEAISVGDDGRGPMRAVPRRTWRSGAPRREVVSCRARPATSARGRPRRPPAARSWCRRS